MIRPSNSEEIVYSYQYIFSKTNNPKALVLTRQNIDYLETNTSYEDFKKGYYELAHGTDATIFASGSEVNLAMEVSKLLKGKSIQIISTPILNKLKPELIESLGINNKVDCAFVENVSIKDIDSINNKHDSSVIAIDEQSCNVTLNMVTYN